MRRDVTGMASIRVVHPLWRIIGNSDLSSNLLSHHLKTMAEVFGIVAGAAGLAGLSMPCVECFEYIRLGRHFGKDYEACQIKLDVIALRLSRWGLLVGLSENPNPNSPPIQPQVVATQKELKILAKVLNKLLRDLQEAKKRSEEYEADSDDEDNAVDTQVCDPNTQLNGRFKLLHITTTGLVAKRKQKGANFWQKTKWALHEKKAFDRLIDDLTSYMDSLENVFAAQKTLIDGALASTSSTEVSGLSDNEDLKLLATIAGSSDKALVEAVESTLAAKGDTWKNFEVSGEDALFRAHIGNNIMAGQKHHGGVFGTFKVGGVLLTLAITSASMAVRLSLEHNQIMIMLVLAESEVYTINCNAT
jgi:hypothetical protein